MCRFLYDGLRVFNNLNKTALVDKVNVLNTRSPSYPPNKPENKYSLVFPQEGQIIDTK